MVRMSPGGYQSGPLVERSGESACVTFYEVEGGGRIGGPRLNVGSMNRIATTSMVAVLLY